MTSLVSHASTLLGAVIDDQSVSVSSEVDSENLSQSYFLYQNYPNPFNPTTSIIYKLKIPSIINVSNITIPQWSNSETLGFT